MGRPRGPRRRGSREERRRGAGELGGRPPPQTGSEERGGGEAAGGDPGLRSRGGAAAALGGRPSRPSARSLATSPSPAQPLAFPSSREKRAARPSPRFRVPVWSVAGAARGGGGRARALEGWGEASWWPESGPAGPLRPPRRARGPEALLDFEPAPATWAGTRRAGPGRERARGTQAAAAGPARPRGLRNVA